MTAPLAFISYSHDSPEHKEWVLELALYLREKGIDVILDQWDVLLGDDLPRFMETGLTNAKQVLLICTDGYLKKANNGDGGVGYEKRILTEQLLAKAGKQNLIPVVRDVKGEKKLPTFMGAPLYLDMSGDGDHAIEKEKLLKQLHGIGPAKPALGPNPFVTDQKNVASTPDKSDTGPYLRGVESTALFASRFAQAFPGVRGIKWFTSFQGIKMRLLKLLEPPLVYLDGTPIWWWRGTSNLQVETFEFLGDDLFLMNIEELRIAKMAAVHYGSYFRNFVYIETIPSLPTGLYDNNREHVEECASPMGYLSEEYGLFEDGHFVSRAEYDDGAAIINGDLVDIRGKVELRARFISPYNFLIAGNASPINNNDFDFRCEELLDGILAGSATFEQLAEEIRRLPRRPR